MISNIAAGDKIIMKSCMYLIRADPYLYILRNLRNIFHIRVTLREKIRRNKKTIPYKKRTQINAN